MRQSLFLPLLCIIISLTFTPICSANLITSVFVNEFHYDNEGADSNEFFELAGIAGINLTGWQIKLFNGSNSLPYGTINLSGVFKDDSNGFGFLSFDHIGIQNGAPDGFALITSSNDIVQFLSYEGVITAEFVDGITKTSQDIEAIESDATQKGSSLQLSDIKGGTANNFKWLPAPSTKGSINNNQTLVPIPEPKTFILLLCSILLLIANKSLRRRG